MMSPAGQQVEWSDAVLGQDPADGLDHGSLQEVAARGVGERLPGPVEVDVLEVEMSDQRLLVPQRPGGLEPGAEQLPGCSRRQRLERALAGEDRVADEYGGRLACPAAAKVLANPQAHRRVRVEAAEAAREEPARRRACARPAVSCLEAPHPRRGRSSGHAAWARGAVARAAGSPARWPGWTAPRLRRRCRASASRTRPSRAYP